MLKKTSNCTGCAACEYICPTNAIVMREDSEHFLQPHIDVSKCIDCKLCDSTCNRHLDTNTIINAYAMQISSKSILSQSTSGGAVTALCNAVLKNGGIIYAASYSVSEGCFWTSITQSEDLAYVRGSKYLQIGLRGSDYEAVKSELKKGPVLFIGTPCQVDGIRKALSDSDKKNLFLIDIICGGVISPWIEELYEKYVEKKNKHSLTKRVFRGKKDNLWRPVYYSEDHYSDGTVYGYYGEENLYTRAFISERLLRESCYQCEYTSINRVGDITVGDCWGIEKEAFDFPEKEKGVSIVLVNTEKGGRLLGETDDAVILPLQNNAPLKCNKPLHKATNRHKMRNYSYDIYKRFSFKIATNIVCYRYLIKSLLKR